MDYNTAVGEKRDRHSSAMVCGSWSARPRSGNGVPAERAQAAPSTRSCRALAGALSRTWF